MQLPLTQNSLAYFNELVSAKTQAERDLQSAAKPLNGFLQMVMLDAGLPSDTEFDPAIAISTGIDAEGKPFLSLPVKTKVAA